MDTESILRDKYEQDDKMEDLRITIDWLNDELVAKKFEVKKLKNLLESQISKV
jgi:hypothetical protein